MPRLFLTFRGTGILLPVAAAHFAAPPVAPKGSGFTASTCAYFLLVWFWLVCLRRCKGFPPVAASRGYSLVAVSGLLLMVASDVVEYGLWGCRLQKLQLPGSRAQTR